MKFRGKEIKRGKEFIDSDPHTALFWELSESKASQYEEEAAQLLSHKNLSKMIGKFMVDYAISDGEAAYELYDPSNPSVILAGMEGPLPLTRKNKIERITELFAHSEATALIESR